MLLLLFKIDESDYASISLPIPGLCTYEGNVIFVVLQCIQKNVNWKSWFNR